MDIAHSGDSVHSANRIKRPNDPMAIAIPWLWDESKVAVDSVLPNSGDTKK